MYLATSSKRRKCSPGCPVPWSTAFAGTRAQGLGLAAPELVRRDSVFAIQRKFVDYYAIVGQDPAWRGMDLNGEIRSSWRSRRRKRLCRWFCSGTT